MKNFIFFLSILVASAVISCQSNDPNEIAQNQLRDELMDVHNEVMPKMGQLNKLRKQLEKIADTEAAGDEEALLKIHNTIKLLEDADEGMMAWMGDFKTPSKLRKTMSHEEIMKYLQDEKVKINKVKDDIYGSMKSATAIIDSYKKAE